MVLHAAPGTDPGALQRTYVKLLGPINHFYAKAMQVVQLSERPQVALHQQLPGVRLRFTHNNGLQHVHVDLAVPNPVSGGVPMVPPVYPPRAYLAIDVLVSGEYYRAASSNSFPLDYPDTYGRGFRDDYATGVVAAASLGANGDGDLIAANVGSRTGSPLVAAPALRSIEDETTTQIGSVDDYVPEPDKPEITNPVTDDLPARQLLPDLMVIGFLVDTEALGTGAAPVTIDLYLASTTQKRISYVDDSVPINTLTRSALDDLEYRIRVRELDPTQPVGVVEILWRGEYRLRAQSRISLGGTPPEYEEIDADDEFAKVIWDGGFFASQGWAVLEGDPLNPEETHMGMLLAETVVTETEVASIVDPLSEFVSMAPPPWTDPVESMTKVATVIWLPSPTTGVPGAATIELT